MPSASTIKGSAPVYSRFRFGALGTQWEIATGEPLDAALRQLILKRIDDFEVLALSRRLARRSHRRR